MISLYFGIPGAGKTTLLVRMAITEARRIVAGKSKYKNVFTNVAIDFPFIRQIPFDFLGKYNISDSLILIDEASLFADNRDWKKMSDAFRDFVLTHRHYHDDIVFFSQGWDAVDKKIRTCCNSVFYIKASKLLPSFTIIYQLDYGIYIPVQSADASSSYGEIAEGYRLPPFLSRLLAKRFWRKPWYKYFDSYERKQLPDLPDNV